MKLKSDNRGLTLVELLVAISLLSIVLGSAYLFLSFSYRSLADTQASFDIGDDVKISLMSMENNIRKAQSVLLSDGSIHKGVELQGSGTGINVYTNIDSDVDMELVQYKFDGGALVRGMAELNSAPTNWSKIVDRVKMVDNAGSSISLFKINGSCVSVELYVVDQAEHFKDNPVCVKASYTVRSKEAMK